MVDAILQASARVLIERGYAGMSTNVVAQQAGVSVGSLYQYFPNKQALLAALHNRHALQMAESLEAILAAPGDGGLRGEVQRLVRGAMAAHELEPQLHLLLEKERPFFEEHNEVGTDIHRHIRRLLADHSQEVGHRDLALAAWMTMRMTESLVHSAVLHPPRQLEAKQVEGAIVDAICAFLFYSPSGG
jgi:AcrR family transcriptional regulator